MENNKRDYITEEHIYDDEDITNLARRRQRQELNKGDFTQYLIEYAKSKKLILLHTWVYKGMVGIIEDVDLRNRVFTFYNYLRKSRARYSINIVRGIEEVNEEELKEGKV